MLMKSSLFFLSLILFPSLYAQDCHFTSVNPVLFSYKTEDVSITPPQKYNNGVHLLSPDPQQYPWESRLENGMPNAMVDPNGNISVYFSSFIVFSPTPPSKVGVMAFTNTTSDFMSWTRPNANLYWYNAAGKTADEKISPDYKPGYQNTNLVAVDIESLGIYDDKTALNPIKLIYMPQREFKYRYLGAYEMKRSFTPEGILTDFSKMKADRLQTQSIFTFQYINADTHMNWMFHNGRFFFTSRVNSRRSALLPGETVPFKKDPRRRFRRSTLTEVGEKIQSENVDFNVVLDCSTEKWEPYSMQPFRLPGFEKDIFLGLVTMYGVDKFPDVAQKQRTELAISNDGFHWRYIKPGTPFLDNSTNPSADDFGCINIATPIYHTKLHSGRNPLDPFFFYASSRIGHTEGRNPGISLAMSKYGKLAGLQAGNTEKIIYSVSPLNTPGMTLEQMPHFSISNAFAINAKFYPFILGDITEDPSGKNLTQLNSYAAVRIFAYNPNVSNGMGANLGGTFGSSQPKSHTISDDYMAVPFITNGIDGTSKEAILRYLKSVSNQHPQQIISIKEFEDIPIVFETRLKNSIFYGVEFCAAENNTVTVNIDKSNDFTPPIYWSFKPASPALSECYTEDFANINHTPNEMIPTQMEVGTIALKITPSKTDSDQTALRMYGNDQNYMSVDYLNNGNIRYYILKEGVEYLNMQVAPPAGNTFQGKELIVTIEVVKPKDRKYDQNYNEDTSIMRLKCPELNYEQTIRQRIIWNFRRDNPTPVDSCYARGYAYLPFSAFVGNMNKITIGGENETGKNKFTGSIHQIEIAKKLPQGSSDFWSDHSVATIRRKMSNK